MLQLSGTMEYPGSNIQQADEKMQGLEFGTSKPKIRELSPEEGKLRRIDEYFKERLK